MLLIGNRWHSHFIRAFNIRVARSANDSSYDESLNNVFGVRAAKDNVEDVTRERKFSIMSVKDPKENDKNDNTRGGEKIK